MADETHDNGGGSTATTRPRPTRRPGLIRSVAHRLAGERLALPVEGRLAAFDRRDAVAQLRAADARGTSGTGRPRRFLDLHLRQLAADAPLPPRMGGEIRRRRADRRGGAHAGVRVRANIDNVIAQSRNLGVEYPVAVDNDYTRLARLRQPLLASAVPRRRRGPHPVPPLRRGRVRHGRDGRPAAPARGRRGRHRPGPGDGRAPRPGGGGRLADAAIARDVPRLRPEQRLRLGRPARGSTGPTAYAAAPRLPLNYWDLSGTWTVAQHAALLDEPGGRVAFQFQARDVNLVMGPAAGPGRSRSASSSTARRWTTPPEPTSRPTAADASRSSAPTSWSASPGRSSSAGSRSSSCDAGAEAYCFTFG